MANTNPVVTITMENGDVMKAELYPEIILSVLSKKVSTTDLSFIVSSMDL